MSTWPVSAAGQDKATASALPDVNEAIRQAEIAQQELEAPPPPEAFITDSGIGLPIGSEAPDFTLTSHTWREGKMYPENRGTLYERLARQEILLVFLPSVWDPYSFDLFQTLLADELAFKATNTGLLFITANTVGEAAEFRASRRVPAEIIHDPDHVIFDLYQVPLAMDTFPRQRVYYLINKDRRVEAADPLWHYLGEHEDLINRLRARAAKREGFESYGEYAEAHPENRTLADDWFWLEQRRKDREALETKQRIEADRDRRIAEARAKLDAYRAERAKNAPQPASMADEQAPDFTFPVVTYENGVPQTQDTTLQKLCEKRNVILVFTPSLDFRYFNKVIKEFDNTLYRMKLNQTDLVIVYPGSLKNAIEYREVFKSPAYVKPDTTGDVFKAYDIDFNAKTPYPRHPVEFPLFVLGPDRKIAYANPWFHYQIDLNTVDEVVTKLAVDTGRRIGKVDGFPVPTP